MKDFCTTVAVAYIVYKLLCLKDPSRYYGKPSNDPIDIINIAINAEQARTVFFNRFKSLVAHCQWFAGKSDPKRDSIEFDKHITVYSGHSEREAHEGLNLLIAVLDEISGFALESSSETGKSGEAIYKMFRGSVDSRFPELGKVVLLSFPRYDGDFITAHYNSVVASKQTIQYDHTFVINHELPASHDGNTFDITWEEDEIEAYMMPGIYALKKPTWKVNPTIELESLKGAFYRNPADALSRFACMPVSQEGSFFRYPDRLKQAFHLPNQVIGRRDLPADWRPHPDREYFLHVDLSQQVDKCALAVSYVDRWVKLKNFGIDKPVSPYIVTEFIVFWEPQREGPVDFKEVKEWILDFRGRGAHIKICTFDRWNSFDLIKELKENGIKSEVLSVAKHHYEDFALLVYEERFAGPDLPAVIKEMLALRVIKQRVDHPRAGYKDLSDAVVGSVYNSIRLSTRGNATIHVYDMRPRTQQQQPTIEPQPKPDRRVVEWLERARVI